MLQVFNLSETSKDIIARFQDHNQRVHRELNRLPENVLQVPKVSKLHSINNSTMQKYREWTLMRLILLTKVLSFFIRWFPYSTDYIVWYKNIFCILEKIESKSNSKGSGDEDEEMSYNDLFHRPCHRKLHQEYQEYSFTCNRLISLVMVKILHF